MPLSPRIFGLRPWKHHENYQFYSLPNVYEMGRARAVCDFLMLLASNIDIKPKIILKTQNLEGSFVQAQALLDYLKKTSLKQTNKQKC